MDPKQKAENIFNRYKKICDEELNNSGNFELAKEYSLIAVDEVIEAIGCISVWISTLNYWQEVKEELNKI